MWVNTRHLLDGRCEVFLFPNWLCKYFVPDFDWVPLTCAPQAPFEARRPRPDDPPHQHNICTKSQNLRNILLEQITTKSAEAGDAVGVAARGWGERVAASAGLAHAYFAKASNNQGVTVPWVKGCTPVHPPSPATKTCYLIFFKFLVLAFGFSRY